MRTRLFVLAALVVGVIGVAAMGASASSQSNTTTLVGVGHLKGGVEIPPGDPTGNGTIKVTVNTNTGQVCWKFTIIKIDGKPTAAHIHKGKAGVAGPVVVPFGTSFKKAGCTKASFTLVKDLVTHPRQYYVNVHNAKHPAGAIRTQLKKL